MSDDRIRVGAKRPTSEAHRVWSKNRRAINDFNGDCINENKTGTHGPATHGVRCAACAVVHKRTA